MIGTSDQSCWLAEACKSLPLDGLWMYGMTVSGAVTIRGYRNKNRIPARVMRRPLYTWHMYSMFLVGSILTN